MADAWTERPEATNEPTIRTLHRPLPSGVVADISFADTALERYAGMEAAPVAAHAVAALGHFRLAALAAAQLAETGLDTLEFDLVGGAALRHLAEAVTAGGRWLAEAYDLRLPRSVRPDPASKELLARLAFADPAVQGQLRNQQAWLRAIQDLGRRASREPLALRADRSDELPGPTGPAAASVALAAHLERLAQFLRSVATAAVRQAEAGPRPVREQVDDAWLHD